MNELTVSVSPHIRDRVSTRWIMLDVIIALVPALVASVVIFGARALLIVLVCVLSCNIFEAAFERLVKRGLTVGDMSASVTGILLAFNLPVSIPLWQAAFGGAVAIVLVKQLFGGLGKNFANPAITARIVMFLAFSTTMTTWTGGGGLFAKTLDAVTGATPLTMIARGAADSLPPLRDMILGLRGGCIGETSAIALAIGGIYLVARKIISWHTPVTFILTVLAFTALLGREPVYQVFSGGLFLGAIFMATDYVTTPQTSLGRLIFGIGAGALTTIIRVYGSYPEGVSYSILLMNIVTPYINKLTMRKAFGGART
ncbi:MAG: RnfABCDGE type electron transport complex subunit D [Oscillospiraceae bacterium]|jgi:electron transport complex protein RnfD|nr:RnfABCDGE type electron transport complex subunit D [Oscillospiraceae bacterium]